MTLLYAQTTNTEDSLAVVQDSETGLMYPFLLFPGETAQEVLDDAVKGGSIEEFTSLYVACSPDVGYELEYIDTEV